MRETLMNRPFRLLFLAQCASFFGDAIFLVSVPFAVLQVTDSGSALGTVLASGATALVAAFTISGVWADRLPRIPIMISTDALRLVSLAILAVLLVSDEAKLWQLIVLAISYNIGTAFFQPARTGLVPQLLETHRLVAANGLMSTAESLVFAAGFAVGGILVATVSAGWTIAIGATSYLLSALFLSGIRGIPAASKHEDREPFLRELSDGFKEVKSRRWIWYTLTAATMFLLLFEGPMQVAGPITMKELYEGARTWGLLLGALGVGATIGAIVVALELLERPMLWSLWLFFACPVVPLLILFRAPSLVIAACYVVVGASFGLFDPIWNSALQRGVPPTKLSRVSAWDWMASLAGMPIGMALTGWLIDLLGKDATLIGIAIGTLITSILFIVEPSVRRLDQITSPTST